MLDAAISLCYYNVPNYVTVLIINKVVKYGRIVCGFISGDEPFRKTADRRILGRWIKKFNKVADLVVIEGPKAGGHLGFKVDEISEKQDNYDNDIKEIIACVKDFEESGGSRLDLQNDRSERPAQYLCRSDGEWGGHAAKYDMHHAGIWQGSHFADG